jgi:FixJ family two-component response regulator
MANGLLHSYDRLTAYIVDDEPEVRSVLSRVLARAGFDVQCFASADDARLGITRAGLERSPVDVVLLDMRLQSGAESTQQAEDLLATLVRRQPQPEVVVMSGHLSSDDFFHLMLRGARDFLSKPWDNSELVRRVRDAATVGRQKYRHHYAAGAQLIPVQRDAFLSYSSRNADLAMGLKRILERMGVTTWYADADLSLGASWPDTLDAAIHTCSVFIVLFTPDAVDSGYVLSEIRKAVARKDQERDEFLLVPLVYGLAPHELPERLRTFQAVDLTDRYRFVDNVVRLADRVTRFVDDRARCGKGTRRRVERRSLSDRRISPVAS